MEPMIWAEKLAAIQPFRVMEVLGRAKALEAAGRDVVRLEVGEPDFPTPEPVLAAARRALDRDETRYTPSLGLPALRTAIAQWYGERHGVDLDPGRVVLTPGTSGAFLLAFGLLLDPGQRVAIADPGYPCYPNLIRFLGGEPVAIPVGPEERYQLSPERLEPALRQGLRAALVTSPGNPSGTLIPDATLAALVQRVEEAGAWVISDEIYHGITYDEPARTALEFSPRAIVINGFSKFFAMTGWRLGWLIVPEQAIPKVEALAQNLFIAAPTLSQHAALAAFDCEPALRRQVLAYDHNRRLLLDGLRQLGFVIPVEPTGAFYIYADAGPLLDRLGVADTQILCQRLLEEAGVAVTPGLDFGAHRAERHLRFSYAVEAPRITLGLERLAAFLAQA